MNLRLGPLLGVEGNDRYTVCILTRKDSEPGRSNPVLSVSFGADTFAIRAESATALLDHLFVRFAFDLPASDEAVAAEYVIKQGDNLVVDRHGRNRWQFEVPAREGVPRIAYCSCNGDSHRHPRDADRSEYAMWQRMADEHEEERFHYLLMGGDQLYADSIWDEVDVLRDLEMKIVGRRFRRLRGIWNKLTGRSVSKAVAEYRIPSEEREGFEEQLARFYEQLYVDAWSDQATSYMLSSVPTVMMWDDHDIFDGWGSHSDELQRAEVFATIFRVARRYFEIFQVRTDLNRSLFTKSVSTHHYSMHVTLRSVEVFVLDNRSSRTQYQIMADEQYEDLKTELATPKSGDALFANASNAREKVLCFVIPVPVAHLDYASRAEGLLNQLAQSDFRRTVSDDAIDHWDHAYHKEEQKRLLDLVFDAARKHTPYYVCLVSGDVHTAGAATITHDESNDKVTQLISSGIAHAPPARWQSVVMRWASTPLSTIAGYTLDLKHYGDYEKRNVDQRNFAYLCKPAGQGVIAVLHMERGMGKRDPGESRDPLVGLRTLNKFSN